MIDHRLARFVAVGSANTALGLAIILGAQAWLGMGPVEANALGYGLGIAAGFVLNRQWTFEHAGAPGPALARYLAVLAAAYAANLATVLAAIEVLGLRDAVAQAAGVAPYAAVGYLGSRWFAFSEARR